MFRVSEDGSTIELSRGDTGAIRFKVRATYYDTGEAYTFGVRDRAIFTIKNGAGEIIKEKAYPLTDNEFVVNFANQDTDTCPAGEYTWDVRYVINPYYDESDPQKIISGDQVITPELPQRTQILNVVGDV